LHDRDIPVDEELLSLKESIFRVEGNPKQGIETLSSLSIRIVNGLVGNVQTWICAVNRLNTSTRLRSPRKDRRGVDLISDALPIEFFMLDRSLASGLGIEMAVLE
jgi:hypothetical protein